MIVITGCTSGLGLHLAREYIRLGHVVAGCGRRTATIDALNKEFGGTGSFFHTADVAKERDVIRFSQEVDRRCARVDVLICNAGLGGYGKLSWEIPSEALSNIVDVSLKGLMYTNKHFIPFMLKGLTLDSGPLIKRVINLSSGVGHTSMPGAADYCSVKFGVEGWSKCVAQEFKAMAQKAPHIKDRIMCVPFAPGVVRSEMNSGNPNSAPVETWCKDAAPFLLNLQISENGSSITMPGYYSQSYKDAWIVADGAKMNSSVSFPSAK